MCRFLLQHGADVDHVASNKGPSGYQLDFSGSALVTMHNDDEAEDDVLGPILVCRELLLGAGCDPMIPIDDQGRIEQNIVTDVLQVGVPVIMIHTY